MSGDRNLWTMVKYVNLSVAGGRDSVMASIALDVSAMGDTAGSGGGAAGAGAAGGVVVSDDRVEMEGAQVRGRTSVPLFPAGAA